jgi:hypothetical protein
VERSRPDEGFRPLQPETSAPEDEKTELLKEPSPTPVILVYVTFLHVVMLACAGTGVPISATQSRPRQAVKQTTRSANLPMMLPTRTSVNPQGESRA